MLKNYEESKELYEVTIANKKMGVLAIYPNTFLTVNDLMTSNTHLTRKFNIMKNYQFKGFSKI